MDPTTADGILAALLGALVGVGELNSRYRDEPRRAIINLPALLYVGINAVAAAVALAAIDAFGWKFGTTNDIPLHWTRVLVAGFGAMALFRSSFFTIRAGEQEVGVGPSSVLEIILIAADRAVDRQRATARAAIVSNAMADILSFEKVYTALPTFCLALMQNLAKEDQEQLARQVTALQSAAMDDRMKLLSLGLALMNAVGEDVLIAAVNSLGPEYKVPKGPKLAPVSGASGGANSSSDAA